jgi:hypothetical protein
MKDDKKFTCDNCFKQRLFNKDGSFPYEDGWKFLKQFNFKTKQNHFKIIGDRQYCSIRCFSENIMIEIIKEEEFVDKSKMVAKNENNNK